MNKITILAGIPGSGKSTWARGEMQKSGNTTVVVSRDELRNRLFGYTEQTISHYWTLNKFRVGAKEKKVSEELDSLIRRALRQGKDVIVDNTHVKKTYINHFKRFWAELEMKYIDCDLAEAKARDAARVRVVGDEIIEKFHASYVNLNRSKIQSELDDHNVMVNETIFNDPSKPPIYIFDIDGTLAHMDGRKPFDYKLVHTDLPDKNLVGMNLTLEQETPCYVVSGRDDDCRTETADWLDANGIKYEELIMRKTGDQRTDWLIKQEIWADICKDYYITMMFDDRDQVVDRARQLGFKVCQVAPGDF